MPAGERCSCTTAITDLFRSNFDMNCMEGTANPHAAQSECIIGGLPWKHGTCLASAVLHTHVPYSARVAPFKLAPAARTRSQRFRPPPPAVRSAPAGRPLSPCLPLLYRRNSHPLPISQSTATLLSLAARHHPDSTACPERLSPLPPPPAARFFTPRQRHWPRPGARPPFPRSVRPCAVRDDAKSARVNGCRRSTRMDGGRRSTRMDFGRRWTRIVVAAARRPACITLGHGVGIAGRLEAGPRGGRACGVVHPYLGTRSIPYLSSRTAWASPCGSRPGRAAGASQGPQPPPPCGSAPAALRWSGSGS